jgi:hypothetical protein
MAKLIITRPRITRFDAAWALSVARSMSIPILVDGERVASIRTGRGVELEVASGHHRLRVGGRLFGSQTVEVDVDDELPRVFALGPGCLWRRLMIFSISAMAVAGVQTVGLALCVSS